MDRSIVFVLVFIVATSVAYYFWQEHEVSKVLSQQHEVKVAVPESTVDITPSTPRIRYPVPSVVEETAGEEIHSTVQEIIKSPDPLPTLEESDIAVKARLQEIYAPENPGSIFIIREFIRHFVVTIDNLDGRKLAKRYSITRPPEATFIVKKSGTEDEYTVDKENEKRYEPYMKFLSAVNDQQFLSIYVRFYPLFQEAYEELGYPERYFNDRLIEIIDHMLRTPVTEGDITLVRPKVYYQFADSNLENLSAGQKILIRIGTSNAQIVRERLRSIRKLLTTIGA